MSSNDPTQENIFSESHRMVTRGERESALGQKGGVFWFYGLSGSGKSTLAIALQHQLHQAGKTVQVLDGDTIRTGLNKDLGFTDDDRRENIRRIAEVAKLFANAGIITLVSFITPKRELRESAREIIGEQDFHEIYVKASFEECAKRDVKGLYAKAAAGGVKHFTGKDSGFEEPDAGVASLVVDTEGQSFADSLAELSGYVLPRVDAQ
ncbi:adenylyl-sulfate kinase [Sulfuriroseicoccus oceanibius]|uniref:Adenylyl-sulfate kinase n=1 Tax=Sulfuriroseicoccus oceanibius TaxID=2707525 RepID=A0A6B3L7B0_9BACT|nr:adenylyl-sulfate kinase [Sulfuriroseicoccus oceanibius]QQL45444.1 adenylyl-sulfate kinase [Sulfuriroseicoccus oceanibius]